MYVADAAVHDTTCSRLDKHAMQELLTSLGMVLQQQSAIKSLKPITPREKGCHTICNDAYAHMLCKQGHPAMSDAQGRSRPWKASSRRILGGTRGVGVPPSGQAGPCPGRQLAACRLYTAAFIKASIDVHEGGKDQCAHCTTHAVTKRVHICECHQGVITQNQVD